MPTKSKTKKKVVAKSFDALMDSALQVQGQVVALVNVNATALTNLLERLQKQLDASAPKTAPSGLAQLMAKYSKNGGGTGVSADVLRQQIEDASSLLRHLDAIAQAAETGNTPVTVSTATPVVTSVRTDDRYEILIQAARLTTNTSTPAAVRDAIQKLAARLGGDASWDLVDLLNKAAGAVDRPLHDSGTYAMNHVRETMAKYAGIDPDLLRSTASQKAMSTKEIEERFVAFIDGELAVLGDVAEALTGDREADEETIKSALAKLQSSMPAGDPNLQKNFDRLFAAAKVITGKDAIDDVVKALEG